ncbi:CAF1 family ribonuclease containing protein [Aphelenchoides avenae]|nr:CAF1 family ribonuclease containing protein [Aphelenchus avenae]
MFENVPIVEINRTNLNAMWTHVMSAIHGSQLVAIDLELSGLGEISGPHGKSFPERYKIIRETARTRSVLSMGITTFKLKKCHQFEKRIEVECQVFDILLVEDDPFTVDPDSMAFLQKHGFDFNKCFSLGIQYSKDRKKENRKAMHSLWEEILASGVCITLHNGLVDLAFIHEHFYAELPVDPDVFTANLADWFPAFNAECSVFDSKYVAEYGEHFSTSFLEYLFRKCQRLNWTQRETGMVYIDIRFPPVEGRLPIISEAVEHISCRISERFRNRLPYNTTAKEVCETFRQFGFCKRNRQCGKSHEVDHILDLEEQNAAKKRKRQRSRYDDIWRGDSVAAATSNGAATNGATASASASNGHSKNDANRAPSKGTSPSSPPRKSAKVYASAPHGLWRNGADASSSPLNGSAQNGGENKKVKSTDCLPVERSHRAGMDSFMTGFATLYMQRMSVFRTQRFDSQFAGHLPLPGNERPLALVKSRFVAQSEGHICNWARISGRRLERRSIGH